ncbi:hypothetical protein [Neptunicella marina]|uniref:Uncharacterized protein n=1 Tax=Neptunicella marina TaxID=2125989 RepID=A0A8J6ITS7_9ALTE|nr:hypothetical protein [Neptunicella marina]MBC3766184.1 hypothetical protein [Neptunicella marina]
MTERNQDQLNQLYEQRKQQYKSPSAIKSHLLAKNKARNKPTRSSNLINWTFGVTALSALLVLFQYMQLNQHQAQPLQITRVQVHSLHQESNNTNNNSVSQQGKVQLAQNYARFLKSQELLVAHHQAAATLLNNQDGWRLQTCDKQLVEITQPLVEAMEAQGRFEQHLNNGQMVLIDFDQQGHIVAINATTKHQC